ncbi:hypothetical protein BV22DRAFT_464351 [Leucogyrophana mollusca]|uniref:Uncharacterized protein n=1 Tax=Leucogyrophana mollusca TaxID=85980 RepID=A0ACB8BJP7_9AGAM|nr:hypothetical protein BV22DRAFT_464351 [Leucogyrophana mollusca]
MAGCYKFDNHTFSKREVSCPPKGRVTRTNDISPILAVAGVPQIPLPKKIILTIEVSLVSTSECQRLHLALEGMMQRQAVCTPADKGTPETLLWDRFVVSAVGHWEEFQVPLSVVGRIRAGVGGCEDGSGDNSNEDREERKGGSGTGGVGGFNTRMLVS